MEWTTLSPYIPKLKHWVLRAFPITPDNNWDAVGVIVHWESDPPHMQLRGLISHTVSRPIWHAIGKRVDEYQLTLETYHRALEEYERYYRILPEIYALEAPTAADLRRILREKYVFTPELAMDQAILA